MATLASDRLKHDIASDRVAAQLRVLREENSALQRALASARIQIAALTIARDAAIRVAARL